MKAAQSAPFLGGGRCLAVDSHGRCSEVGGQQRDSEPVMDPLGHGPAPDVSEAVPAHDGIPSMIPAPAARRSPGRVSAKQTACTCVDPSFPCYATIAGQGPGCFGITNATSCAATGGPGEFCSPAPCVVSNCAECDTTTGLTCNRCSAGFVGPQCQPEDAFFADVQVSILPPDADGRVGVVALSSPSLHAQLSAGMHGTGDRAAATSLIARAFARLVHDRFTLIYVYPSSQVGLNGAHDFQFYFRTPGGLGSLASLQGVVNGGNPLQDGFYKASMLELTHNYVSPQTLLSNNIFGAHWGLSTLSPVGGMIGGYAHGAITCMSGRVPTPSHPCHSHTVHIDNSRGSPETSNDFHNTAFPNVELYLMGLLSASELLHTNETITYCPITSPNASTVFNASANVITANCSGGLQFFTAQQVVDAYPRTGREMIRGQTIRTPIVVVYPDASSVPTAATAFTEQEAWLVEYYATRLPPLFAAATGGRASIDFMVTADDLQAPPATPTGVATSAPPALSTPATASMPAPPSGPDGSTLLPPLAPSPPAPGDGMALSMTLVCAGDVSSFDTTAFAATLAARLGVGAADVILRLSGASVTVTAQVRAPATPLLRATALSAMELLVANASVASAQLGVTVESIAAAPALTAMLAAPPPATPSVSPASDAAATGSTDAEGIAVAALTISTIILAVLIVVACWSCRLRTHAGAVDEKTPLREPLAAPQPAATQSAAPSAP